MLAPARVSYDEDLLLVKIQYYFGANVYKIMHFFFATQIRYTVLTAAVEATTTTTSFICMTTTTYYSIAKAT